MDPKRAEAHLRRLAEAELRRVMALPSGSAASQWHAPALTLAAQALAAAGAIDARVARQILAGFDGAVAARQPRPFHAVSQPLGGPSPAAQARLARLTRVPAARAGDLHPDVRQAASPPGRSQIVPVGTVIPPDGFHGEMLVLAYLQTPSTARFTLAVKPVGLPGGGTGPKPGPPQRHQFTATDDQGRRYQLRFQGIHEHAVLQLIPHPHRQMRWLDLSTAPGEPAVRVSLDTPARQIPAPDLAITSQPSSPGELLMDVIAARTLTIAADYPHDTPEQLAATQPELLPHRARDLGAITAALHAAGALPTGSLIPGQFAGLCARLGISGHGITAPPSSDLPERWESMLTRYHRRAPGRPLAPGSWAAPAIELPKLDGARLAIAGLHHSQSGTTLHALASGVTTATDWIYSRVVQPLPVLWIHDSDGHWHTTWTRGFMPQKNSSDAVLWISINPPLDHATSWIEITADGHSARARARLPLHWKHITSQA